MACESVACQPVQLLAGWQYWLVVLTGWLVLHTFVSAAAPVCFVALLQVRGEISIKRLDSLIQEDVQVRCL